MLKLVTDEAPRGEPASDQEIIDAAIVALRRCQTVESLPRHARRALEAGEDLLESYARDEDAS